MKKIVLTLLLTAILGFASLAGVLSISPIESALATGGGSEKMCFSLGDDHKPSILDQDIFKFYGTKGERVTVTLEMDSSGSHTGKQANLSLMDEIARTRFFRTTTGSLPRTITAVLPATGKYLILVGELPGLRQLESFRGTYCLTLASSAEAHASLTPTLWVESTGNRAPAANAGPDQTVSEWNTAILNGSGSSDPNGDPLTYQWSFISRPTASKSLLSNANTLSPSFVADVAGTYVIQLIVNDGKVNSGPDEVQVTVTTRGVLLPGASTSLAVSAVSYSDSNNGVMESQIGLDEDGRRVARTELEVEFADSATVGEVNGLLNSIGGRIVNMLEGMPILLIRIPDPGSVSGLKQVISQIEANPVVVSVRRAYFPALRALPDNHTSLSFLDKIDHHLAVRAHGAWNVKDGLPDDPGQAPLLLVADSFGGGPPVADFSVWANPDDFGVLPQYTAHGYHVLGIISAEFGGDTSDRGLATGIYPKTLELRAVDLTKNVTDFNNAFLSFPAIEDRILEIIAQAQRPVVLNTSFGFSCGTPSDAAAFCTDGFARSEALRWIRKVRIGNLEGKFIHSVAAGNIAVPGDTDARYDSQFAASRLIGDLQTPGGTPVPPLYNVLVVENVIASGSPPQPICLNGDVANGKASKYHGDLSAVGTDVWSLLGTAGSGAGDMTGTSQAAPQVAGVVAQMWAMDIQKSNLTVINRLLGTTKAVNLGADPRCSAVPPARVVDAYTALLSMDDASGLSPGDLSKLKVRRTLLDVADGAGNPGSNKVFDEKDLELLINILETQPAGLPNYSRYDLNGDGYTGGNKAARFDLDINDPPAFTTVTRDIEGRSISFSENSLTDQQILCYYAYSALYTGDTTTRKELLRDRCAGIVEGYVNLKVDPFVFARYQTVMGSTVSANSGDHLYNSNVGPITRDTGLITVQYADTSYLDCGVDPRPPHSVSLQGEAQAMATADYGILSFSGFTLSSSQNSSPCWIGAAGEGSTSTKAEFNDTWVITPDDPGVIGGGTILLVIETSGTGWGIDLPAGKGWWATVQFLTTGYSYALPEGKGSNTFSLNFTFGKPFGVAFGLFGGGGTSFCNSPPGDCSDPVSLANSITLAAVHVLSANGAEITNFKIDTASGHNYGFGHR